MTWVPAPEFDCETLTFDKKGPGKRSRHCLVHDRGERTTVLFGGLVWRARGVAWCLGDTWELYDQIWQRRRFFRGPCGRQRSGLAYDAHRGFSVLFGGQGNPPWWNMLNDTWIYGMEAVARNSAATAPPMFDGNLGRSPERSRHARRRRLLLGTPVGHNPPPASITIRPDWRTSYLAWDDYSQ